MRNRLLASWKYWVVVVGALVLFDASFMASAETSNGLSIISPSPESYSTYVKVARGVVPATEAAELEQARALELAVAAHDEVGVASWYGGWFEGKRTASGARFDKHKLTAAHRSLPLDTKARVTNLENGRSVEVTVNDRGPYVKGRVLDLSAQAAKKLGMTKRGLALVRIEVIPDDAVETAMN